MTNNLKADIEKIVKDHWETPAFINSTNEETVEKLLTLINQKEKEAEIRGLENLLDGSAEGATCICESAGIAVCDHNWSLCNVVRDRIKQLKEELKGGKD